MVMEEIQTFCTIADWHEFCIDTVGEKENVERIGDCEKNQYPLWQGNNGVQHPCG